MDMVCCVPHVFLVGADAVQGVWCCGGPAGGSERVSLAATRPQTLRHAVQGICLQGKGVGVGGVRVGRREGEEGRDGGMG